MKISLFTNTTNMPTLKRQFRMLAVLDYTA